VGLFQHIGCTQRRMMSLFPRVLVLYLGGKINVDMLVDYEVNRYTLREIQQKYGVNYETARRYLNTMRRKLREIGLEPQQWKA